MNRYLYVSVAVWVLESPFLSTFFCVSVSVVYLASMTSALLFSVLLWLIYCGWL